MKAMCNRFNLTRGSGILLSGIMALVLVSCDPGQRIIIENNTDAPAKITFIFNKDHHYYQFEESRNADTLMVQLDSTENNSVKEYFFGIGTWDIPNSLDSLVAMVDFIEVETWKSKEIFQGEPQVRDFFTSRISGRYQETIDIKLE